MSVFKEKTTVFLLFLLTVLITFSLHPMIVEMSRNAGLRQGSILSRYIVVVFAVLFLLNFRPKESLQSKMIRTFLLAIFIVALFSFFTYGFFDDIKLLEGIRALFISWAALSIGWQLRLSDKQIRNVLLVFTLSTLFVGLMQVFTNVGGFVIEMQYLADDKNVLGVMIATSITVFAFFAMEKETPKLYSIMCWGVVFVLMAIILTIRARTATLISFFIVMLILYRRIARSYFTIILISLPFLLVLGYLILPSGIKEFVFSSFTLGYEDNLTSGRSERNLLALEFLSNHLLLGNLRHEAKSIGWIHNYPLLQLFNNGLVFGLPILILYLYLFIKVVGCVMGSKVTNIRQIGFFAMLIPFIVSLAEPTFPFGPGTATVYNFILFGVAARYKYATYHGQSLKHEKHTSSNQYLSHK